VNKIGSSLRNACYGLAYCFATQRNMAVHTLIGAVVLVVGMLLRVPLTGMLFLLTAITAVLVAEAFNTAVEQTIDIYSKERNQLAHTAKDVAAGAVLLASIFAVLVGLFVLGPPLWRIFKAVLFAASGISV